MLDCRKKNLTLKRATTLVVFLSSMNEKGREVHVTAPSSVISSFMDTDRSSMICFRCGEPGHVRHQCLTYRVRLCWHYENGACAEPNCLFAHGKEQLRTPWKQRCVRVVKHNGRFVCIGCNSSEHTFRKCPLHQDLMIL